MSLMASSMSPAFLTVIILEGCDLEGLTLAFLTLISSSNKAGLLERRLAEIS